MMIPCLCSFRSSSCDLRHKKIPRPNGLVASFLVDIPTRWEPRTNQSNGLRLLIFPQPLVRALKNQNAAPTTPPCFCRRQRSSSLHWGFDCLRCARHVLFSSCTAHHKKSPDRMVWGCGGALSTAVEPSGGHIVAAVRALQTKKRRHLGTFQPLLVCFFQLIFVQSNAVQQITLILGGCIIIDSEPFADSTELVKHFNSSRGHSFDFDIHRSTTFQERYVLKRESAALSAIINMIGPPDCLAKT